MGRLALRPALRAYAHAPAAAPAAAYENTESAYFDGSDDAYTTDNTSIAFGSGANSWSVWIKEDGGFISTTLGIGNEDTRLFGSTNRQFRKYGQVTLSAATTQDVWQHWVVVGLSNGYRYIYRDGAEVAKSETTETVWDSTGQISLGGGGGGFAPGNIDEFACWIGTALSAAEALELYNSGEGYDIKNDFTGTAPTAWYRCGDDAGDSGGASGVLIDQMGNYDMSRSSGEPVIQEDVPS